MLFVDPNVCRDAVQSYVAPRADKTAAMVGSSYDPTSEALSTKVRQNTQDFRGLRDYVPLINLAGDSKMKVNPSHRRDAVNKVVGSMSALFAEGGAISGFLQ